MKRGLPRFDEPAMLAAQMELIDRSFGLAMVGTIFTAAVLAMGIILATGSYAIIWWVAAMAVVCSVGHFSRAWFPQRCSAGQARRYAGAMMLLFFVIGMLWAVSAWLFIDPRLPTTVLYFIITIACTIVGGLAYFSPSLPLVLSHMLSRVLPVCVVVWHTGDIFLGFGSALFLLLMLGTMQNYYKVTAHSIQLRFQNDELVAQLRRETENTDKARLEAEQANRAKSVFMACASHDLRQPMHALGLFMVALRRTTLSAKQEELVGHISASAGAAREMLNTLLDFSRLEAGVVEARPGPLPVQALLLKLESEFAPQARAKQLAFRTRDTQALAYADPLLLEMVLRNLIANAIRYTERGGILLGCRRRGDGIALEVWDTGVGIPAGQHKDIFREFHQLHNPERDRQKGLGLGLAIVDGLAATMGVTIGVASTVGSGSVFSVRLPCLHDGEDADQNHVLPPVTGVAGVAGMTAAAHYAGLRILVIEDDHLSRLVLEELLSDWDCQCMAVASIEEAVLALDGFAPDLVITDFRLRDRRTGNDALAAIAARLGRTPPAIIITGDTAPDRLHDARSSGAILLHKPVDVEALQAAIQQLCAA